MIFYINPICQRFARFLSRKDPVNRSTAPCLPATMRDSAALGNETIGPFGHLTSCSRAVRP